MNEEQMKALSKILYMIINAIDRDYYDPHLTGLTTSQLKECIDLLKILRDEE